MEAHIKSILLALDQGNLPLALDLIQQELKSKSNLGEYSVSIANRLIGSFPWGIISRLLPAGTNFFETSGWVGSIQSGTPIDASGLPLPWFNYACIDFVGRFLIQRPSSVFEWGSGYSSLFFRTYAANVRSCEDNKEWFERIQNLAVKGIYQELVYRPSKVEYINEITGMFDLIVVDGSHRAECLKVAPNHLKPGGIILLDNSDDRSLDNSILELDKEGFYSISFSGLIPSYAYKNVSTVFFRDPQILKLGSSGVPSATVYSSGITCFQAMEKLRRLSNLTTE
jgi:hypothetical protein